MTRSVVRRCRSGGVCRTVVFPDDGFWATLEGHSDRGGIEGVAVPFPRGGRSELALGEPFPVGPARPTHIRPRRPGLSGLEKPGAAVGGSEYGIGAPTIGRATLIGSVSPARQSRVKMSIDPFVSPPTRFVALSRATAAVGGQIGTGR
jgi:hypothetical protein